MQLGGLVGDTMFEAQLGVAHDLTRISCASAAMVAECGAVIDPHHRRRLWHIVRCWERAVKSSQRCESYVKVHSPSTSLVKVHSSPTFTLNLTLGLGLTLQPSDPPLSDPPLRP